MKRKLALIIGITIIVVFSGAFISWFFFFNETPIPQDEKPDLAISDYTLENDNLTVLIANIGVKNAQDAAILGTMAMVTYFELLIIYHNQISLGVNETFVFTIVLTDFQDDLISGNLYSIMIQLDSSDHIKEISEVNNNLSIEYYYEE
jgi:hypothetical protein